MLRSKVGIFANLYRQARELERINSRLAEEATERREAQRELQELNRTLEQRVKARTKDLVDAPACWKPPRSSCAPRRCSFRRSPMRRPDLSEHRRQRKLYYISRRFETFTGLTLEQLRSQGWQQVLHPDDLEAGQQNFLSAISNHSPLSGRMRLRRADGAYRWIESSAVPLMDEQAERGETFGV